MPSPAVTEALKRAYGDRIHIGANCRIDPSVRVEISSGGSLYIGDDTNIMRGVSIEVLRGGVLTIGPRVNIGENVFIAVMTQVSIGEGSALSNMVDLHDHNHRNRTFTRVPPEKDDVNAMGFDCAPIVLEPFVTVSNKVTVTAGVRIGQNTVIGANAVVTRSVPPNCVAAGAPARCLRTFAGPLRPIDNAARMRIGFFGTSIMQHLEAYAPRIFDQMNLPQVGEMVEITEWRTRGYVHGLALELQVRWPHVRIEVHNHGYGGANTRKLLDVIDKKLAADPRHYDLILFSGGINDVWRRFQDRLDEAVDIEEYAANYRIALTRLIRAARRVVCLTETPCDEAAAVPMNAELGRYNAVASVVAREFGLPIIDVWGPFLAAAECRRMTGAPSLWADGVHLSEHGDATLLALVRDALRERGIIDDLLTLDLVDRAEAQRVYPPLGAS
jgi:acetyltransferase-like isoleucine patch superfamily enzyme/lysophospholipase L1-like esterase